MLNQITNVETEDMEAIVPQQVSIETVHTAIVHLLHQLHQLHHPLLVPFHQ
jgi:hypothetical protein